MNLESHLREIQRYCANAGISASALRNLGSAGVVAVARMFLGNLDLTDLRDLDPSRYPAWLDFKTEDLQNRFPEKVRACWGPARKAANIFMTLAAMNRQLCAAYQLDRLEGVMETPLDNVAVQKLRKWAKVRNLFVVAGSPRWTSIKDLTRDDSNKYQEIALKFARERDIPRGRLDVALWEPTS